MCISPLELYLKKVYVTQIIRELVYLKYSRKIFKTPGKIFKTPGFLFPKIDGNPVKTH